MYVQMYCIKYFGKCIKNSRDLNARLSNTVQALCHTLPSNDKILLLLKTYDLVVKRLRGNFLHIFKNILL